MDPQNPPSAPYPPFPPFPPFPPYPPYPPYAPTVVYPPAHGCCQCCAGHGGAHAGTGYPPGVAPPAPGGVVVAPPGGNTRAPGGGGGVTVGDVLGGILNPVQGLIDLFT